MVASGLVTIPSFLNFSRILLLPISNKMRVEQALAATAANPVVVADCYVDGVENWEPQPWGWRKEFAGRTAINIDHHAEDERFFRRISSGNLAIEYVGEHGALADYVPAVINHTDCDSIVSAAILTGLLPPEERFGAAVLSADHTGEENEIADLLQSLDPLRNVEYSLTSLHQLLRGEPLDTKAAELLEKRKQERRRAADLVETGVFQMIGPVAVAKLSTEERISGEFLPALLPDAVLIISASPMIDGRLETKFRLGWGAQAGQTLFSLGIRQLEPNFGGRWNAGSTKRAGGSTADPVQMANLIARQA